MGTGSFYRSRHELIFVFKKGRASHLNNFEFNPIYCDRILARWKTYAKDEAKQLVCGRPQEMQMQEVAE